MSVLGTVLATSPFVSFSVSLGSSGNEVFCSRLWFWFYSAVVSLVLNVYHVFLNPGMEISENQKKLAMLNAQKAGHGKSKGKF